MSPEMNRRPWLTAYPADLPQEIAPEFESMRELFAVTAASDPGNTAIAYFDGALSFRDLDTGGRTLWRSP